MIKIFKHRNELSEYNYKPNTSYDFIPTDSEQRFKASLKTQNDNVSLQYYLQNPIKYNLNNCGFRTPDDFNPDDWGNVYIGCSHTFGIGHHLENTWSYKLNNIVGGKFWNMGLPATGVMSHFRILFGYYKELKIKNIFHYAPPYSRYEFIENGTPTNYIISDYKEGWKQNFGDLMSKSLLTIEQCKMNWFSYTYAIRGLASEIGCNYYVTQGDTGGHTTDDASLQARDLIHHNTAYHHKIYKEFLKLYDETLYEKYSNTQEPIFDIKQYIKDTRNSII
jgi:hypothetical protein